jgi:hypothetical protein
MLKEPILFRSTSAVCFAVCRGPRFARIPGAGFFGAMPRENRTRKKPDQFKTEMMMRMQWKQAVLFLIGGVALSGAACQAQTGAAGPAQAGSAPTARDRDASGPEFSIGGSFYEALTASTSGNGTVQTTTNSQGGMLEVRYLQNPFAGLELTYSYNPANQTIAPAPSPNCVAPRTCADPTVPLTVKASEVGVDYVASKKIGSLRPFAVGGLGFFISSPANSKYEVQTVVRPAFIFGGGVDWAVASHFGVRAQFRDNIYHAPNLSNFNPATGEYTHTAEPMGGFYYSF